MLFALVLYFVGFRTSRLKIRFQHGASVADDDLVKPGPPPSETRTNASARTHGSM